MPRPVGQWCMWPVCHLDQPPLQPPFPKHFFSRENFLIYRKFLTGIRIVWPEDPDPLFFPGGSNDSIVFFSWGYPLIPLCFFSGVSADSAVFFRDDPLIPLVPKDYRVGVVWPVMPPQLFISLQSRRQNYSLNEYLLLLESQKEKVKFWRKKEKIPSNHPFCLTSDAADFLATCPQVPSVIRRQQTQQRCSSAAEARQGGGEQMAPLDPFVKSSKCQIDHLIPI